MAFKKTERHIHSTIDSMISITLSILLFVSSLVASAIAAGGKSSGGGDNLIVETAQGKVKGFVDSDGSRVWSGIRYGVGARWENSVFPSKFSGVYIANYSAPACPQLLSDSNGDPGTYLLEVAYWADFSIIFLYLCYYHIITSF